MACHFGAYHRLAVDRYIFEKDFSSNRHETRDDRNSERSTSMTTRKSGVDDRVEIIVVRRGLE